MTVQPSDIDTSKAGCSRTVPLKDWVAIPHEHGGQDDCLKLYPKSGL